MESYSLKGKSLSRRFVRVLTTGNLGALTLKADASTNAKKRFKFAKLNIGLEV